MHEEYDGYDTVKEKLLVAGLDELQKYGINDFSLRRVASSCNVSCAAPYKHFKGKEAFIDEIFKYINLRWEMLCEQVLLAFKEDLKKQITETCIAYIRFWIANPNFRASLMSAKKTSIIPGCCFFSIPIIQKIFQIQAKYLLRCRIHFPLPFYPFFRHIFLLYSIPTSL